MPLSLAEVGQIVKRVVDHGMGTQDIATRCGITRCRVQKLCKPYRETGHAPPPA